MQLRVFYMFRFFILLFLLGAVHHNTIADDVMPIIAYMGVPNDKTNEANFRDFSNCGFNISLYGYASLQQLVYACDIAQKYGVRVLGHCPETHNTPELAAQILKSNAGFYGYVLQDEPSASEILSLQKEIECIAKVDTLHRFYINLYPYYGRWILAHTKTDTYEEYVDIAANTGCQQISFDFYPVTTHGIRDEWYNNLEIIRHRSLAAGKPFWGFVLSTPHGDYPQPTLGMLRLQVYSNLAYGAQAIQYFTYWTPVDKHYDFHNGPISSNGRKTNTYGLVQRMNSELSKIAPLFLHAKVNKVSHLIQIPEGTKRMTETPKNIKKLRVKGSKGALLSEFSKDNQNYLAVVNKDYENSLELHIECYNDVPKKLNGDLSVEKMNSDYSLNAGEIVIFRLD